MIIEIIQSGHFAYKRNMGEIRYRGFFTFQKIFKSVLLKKCNDI